MSPMNRVLEILLSKGFSRPNFAPKDQPIDVPLARKSLHDAQKIARESMMTSSGPIGLVLGMLAEGLSAALDEIEQLRQGPTSLPTETSPPATRNTRNTNSNTKRSLTFNGASLTEAEIGDIAERTWPPTPMGPSIRPIGTREDPEGDVSRSMERRWMKEWADDRRDLRRALAELLQLRATLRRANP